MKRRESLEYEKLYGTTVNVVAAKQIQFFRGLIVTKGQSYFLV